MLAVFVSATVDFKVAVKTPEPLVVPETGESVLPEPDTLKVTEIPAQTFGVACASRAVKVRVVVVVPSAVREVTLEVRVEFRSSAPAHVNETEVVNAARVDGEVMLTVLLPILVELRVAVSCPAESVTEPL
jgi:hypothetical protein